MIHRRLEILILAACIAIVLINIGCDEDNVTDVSPGQLPAPPTMIGAQIQSEHLVEIIWVDRSDNETSFLIYRGESDSMTIIGVTQADQNTYMDGSAFDSSTYYYCVSAVNAFGESPSTDTVHITTPDWSSAPSPPYYPSPEDSSLSSSTDIVLRWNCTDPDYYEQLTFDVYFDNESPPQLVASDYIDTSSSYYYYYYYDLGHLAGFTTYYWQIVAKDEQGHETSGPIWSFTTPLDIALLGRRDLPGISSDLIISGNYAYIINSWIGVMIVDISNAENPVLTTTISTPNPAEDMQIMGNYLYISCYLNQGHSSMLIVDITDPASPASVASYDSLTYPHGIAVDSNYAYVVSHSTGLTIIDISDPANPVLAGLYEDLGGAYDIALKGNYVFIASVTSGMHVIDVTDPANPVQVGAFTMPGGADRIAITGNYAYLSDYYLALLVIVNIENPANPYFEGLYESGNYARNVFPETDYAFLACGSTGMLVLDVFSISDPRLVGSYNTIGDCQGIYVHDNIAYLADGSYGLVILEIEP